MCYQSSTIWSTQRVWGCSLQLCTSTLILDISRPCAGEKAVWPQQSFPFPFPLFPFASLQFPYPEDEDRQRFILNLSVCGKLCERCEWASKVWNSAQIAEASRPSERPTDFGVLPELERKRAVSSSQGEVTNKRRWVGRGISGLGFNL